MDQSPSKSLEKRTYPVLGILLSILVIGTVLSLSYFRIIPYLKNTTPPSKPLPSTSTKPILSRNFLTFNGCTITKGGNPLLEGVRTSGDTVIGTLYGNINQINGTPNKSSTTLEIISPKGEQTYDLTVSEQNGLVYDAIAQKNLKVSDLKVGQTLVASFNCFPKQSNKLLFTRLSIVGKL